jgi:hypothetical protein
VCATSGRANKPAGVPRTRLGRHHGVGDAGQLRDEGWNTDARIHQALETVNHLAAFEQHNMATSVARSQPGEMPVVSKSMTAVRVMGNRS